MVGGACGRAASQQLHLRAKPQRLSSAHQLHVRRVNHGAPCVRLVRVHEAQLRSARAAVRRSSRATQVAARSTHQQLVGLGLARAVVHQHDAHAVGRRRRDRDATARGARRGSAPAAARSAACRRSGWSFCEALFRRKSRARARRAAQRLLHAALNPEAARSRSGARRSGPSADVAACPSSPPASAGTGTNSAPRSPSASARWWQRSVRLPGLARMLRAAQ